MATVNLRDAVRSLTLKIAGYAKATVTTPIDFFRDPANIGMVLAYLASVVFGPYLYYLLPSSQAGYAVAQAGLALLIVPPIRRLAINLTGSAIQKASGYVTFKSAAAAAGAVAAIAYGMYTYSAELQSTTVFNVIIAAVNSIKNVPGDMAVAIGEGLTKAAAGVGWVNPGASVAAIWAYLEKIHFILPGGDWMKQAQVTWSGDSGLVAMSAALTSAASNFFLSLPTMAANLFSSSAPEVVPVVSSVEQTASWLGLAGAAATAAAGAAVGGIGFAQGAGRVPTLIAATVGAGAAMAARNAKSIFGGASEAASAIPPSVPVDESWLAWATELTKSLPSRGADLATGAYRSIGAAGGAIGAAGGAAKAAIANVVDSVWLWFVGTASQTPLQDLREAIVRIEKDIGLSTKSWIPGFSATKGVNDLYFEFSGTPLGGFDADTYRNLVTSQVSAPKDKLDTLVNLYKSASQATVAAATRLKELQANFLKNAGADSFSSLGPELQADYAKLAVLAEREPTLVENVFSFLQTLRDTTSNWLERVFAPIRGPMESVLGPYWTKVVLIFGLCMAAVAAYFLFKKIYDLKFGKSKSVELPARKAFTVVANITRQTDRYVTTMYKVITEQPQDIVKRNAELADAVIAHITGAGNEFRDNFSNTVLANFQALRNQATPAQVVLEYLKTISSLSEQVNQRIESFMILGDDAVTEKLSALRSSLTVMYSCFSIVKSQVGRR